MGGFFLRPETLLWLAPLAALPILIHLLNRRRYRQVDWAAMEFLRRAFERTRRRVRLENLILLLLRVAALSILCLALARPFVGEKSPLAALAQSKRNVVILLDRSYSMGYDDLLGSCFSRAKERAKKLFDDLEPERGDTVSIVLVSDRVEVPVEAALDVAKAREEFDRIEIGWGKSDLLAGIRETSRLVKKLATNQEVWFFTDLRARDWIPREGDDGSRTALKDALAELPIRVNVVDCGTESTANLAITRLLAEERLVVAGSPVAFQADVKNFGSQEAPFELEVWVGDARVAGPPPQTVGPGETRSVPFTHTFDVPGPAAIRVQIANGDALRADDARWFALDVRDAVRVLMVQGKTDGPRLDLPGSLFVYALDPDINEEKDAGEAPSLFSITEIGDFQFRDAAMNTLDRYDLVVLADVDVTERTFPPDAVAKLRERVERGGALLVFAGENVVVESYNNVLRGAAGADSLLPAELLEKRRLVQGTDGGAHFQIPKDSLEQPLVRRLLRQEDFRTSIEAPPVFSWIAARPDPQARTLIALDDEPESPVVIEGSVGKGTGRSVFVATSANRASGGRVWNELPSYPEYLVLMNEIVFWLMSEDPTRRNPLLNEPLLRTFPRFIGDLSITRPDGERATLQVRILEGGRGASVSYADTAEPGVYELRSTEAFSADEAQGVGGLDIFCVNVDAAEGDVTRTNEGEIRSAFGPSFDFALEADGAKAESSPLRGEGELWRHLAFAVLVLVFVESVLAQKFGDYARKRN